jgi:hypothetical protein
MGDWLGTGTIAPRLRIFRKFTKARSWARLKGLKGEEDWKALCRAGKLPIDIPTKPNRTYSNEGWKSWGDWLGTGTVAFLLKKYRPFSKARSWARTLGLKSRSEWRAFSKSGKLPNDIPVRPDKREMGSGPESWHFCQHLARK